MSLVTQFLPQGDSFAGETIPGLTSAWGINPTFAGREYLATGYLKTYSADYASLAANFKSYVANNNTVQYGYGSASNSWDRNYFNNSFPTGSISLGWKLYYLNGNYHSVFHHYTSQRGNGVGYALYGSSFDSAATNGLVQPGYYDYGNTFWVQDSCLFNNYLFVGRAIEGSFLSIERSNGTTYTNGVYIASGAQLRYANGYLMAASPSRMLIFFNLTNGNVSTTSGSVVYTTDGLNFTTTGTSANIYTGGSSTNTSMARLTYSTVGNCFIGVMSNGDIFTSTDGVSWTARTKPTGMPTTVNFMSGSNGLYCANSSSVSLISLGSTGNATYILRTADGVNFSLIDIGTFNLPFFQNATPVLCYDGSVFIATNGSVWFLSTNGSTWVQDYTKVAAPYNYGSGFISYVNGQLWSVGGTSSGDYGTYGVMRVVYSNWTGRYNLAAPQVVGDATARTWASGSSFSSFIRIK